jgi:hypothetical protein
MPHPQNGFAKSLGGELDEKKPPEVWVAKGWI